MAVISSRLSEMTKMASLLAKLLAPKVVAVLSHTAGEWCLVCATISDTFPCSESQGLAH